jgi:tyrosinase
VSHVLDADSFYEFNIRAQGGLMPDEITLHGSAHIAIGGNSGDIANVNSSPGDPLFYLHHANLDRVWEQWQAKGMSHFTVTYSKHFHTANANSSIITAPENRNDFFGPDNEWAYPFNFFRDIPYSNITSDWDLVYSGLSAGNKVRDLMHPQKGPLCYRYE